MFRNVPECSGMFRDVPCSGFYRRPVKNEENAARRKMSLSLLGCSVYLSKTVLRSSSRNSSFTTYRIIGGDRKETESRYKNWREAQSKMAAAGWVMEPFIQLTYNEQCPVKTSQLTETSFIDKRKVNEHFWLDLLQRKCPEGVYNLFNDVCTRSIDAVSLYNDFLSLLVLENRNLM